MLTREKSTSTIPLPGAKLIPVNYEDHHALVKAVAGADAIVSLVSSTVSADIDLKLLKAAQQAGVRRILPSEYTLDVLHPAAVALFAGSSLWPDGTSNVSTARKFLALEHNGGPTSFTTIVPSAFMDGWLEGQFGMFDPKDNKTTLIDGGDHYFTGCSMSYLAATVIAVLQMDEEKTRDKRIHVAEVRATMNEIADAYDKELGTTVERINVSSEELLRQRDANLRDGDVLAAQFLSIHIGAFGGNGAADLGDGLKFDGDGLLNVKKKGLEELVSQVAKKIRS